MDKAKVVIIGAGSSGIAAATKLLELGFQKVTILEGENRIGGRIHTIPFADNVIELGAELCHGEKDNVAYELASKKGLLENSCYNSKHFEYFRSNKQPVPINVTDRLKEVFYEHVDVENIPSSYNGSVGSHLTSKFSETLRKAEYADIDHKLANEFLESHQKMLSAVWGAHTLNDISIKGQLNHWSCEGDNFTWKGKGYLEFLKLLMESSEVDTDGILKGRLQVGKPVKCIKWNERGAMVYCEDGEILEADHVISTVSLGVLKDKHVKLFEPKIPAEKVRAIESIGFGTINKIFIEFRSQFWPDNWGGFNLLWSEEDCAAISGTDRAWLVDIFGFYTVCNQPKILNGIVLGESARYMETLSEDQVLSGCMYLLQRFLPWQIAPHVNFKRSSWYRNEHFHGSYSHPSMMAENLNMKPSDLAKPLFGPDEKPVVLFAGEATSDHFSATVHGAVETGWREALRIAKFYENKS